jgi:ubiquinone/menaquinone biosynthesis C-methylase UbiE
MDPTQRFSSRVESYRLHRPRYPIAVVDWLRDHCNLQPTAAIVDVAAGTGLLSEIFLAQGYSVTAVEPNQAMREACATLTHRFPKLQCVSGTAESTGLAPHCADLVTVAQALHWFDLPRAHAEFVRILQPGGSCAVIYNERRTGGDAFHDGYEHLLREFGSDYEMVRGKYPHRDQLAKFFSSANTASSTMHQVAFSNAQQFNLEGLMGRVLSSSYMPQPGHLRYPAMQRKIEKLFAQSQQDGHVRMDYRCVVTCGKLE